MHPPRLPTANRPGLLAAILILATLLRAWDLGRLSFWYDEVVSMRLALAQGPRELIRLLGEIDATRAPLHPFLLQAWVRVFGPSEAAGRAFSVVCGVLTVALIARIGRRAFDDDATGLWAAGLAAVSPSLVLYSREARMYAWLVLVTCFAWHELLALRGGITPLRLALYTLALVALCYSHPLGLLMTAALGLAMLLNRKALGLSWAGWLAPHLAAAAAVGPWLGRYFDHDPESTVGRQPLKFLLGLPIGFVGGNFLVLAVFVAVIAYGLIVFRRGDGGRIRPEIDQPVAARCLIVWLTVPPLILYGYSRVSHPIFGPERYTLFVAPAYLLLLARGIARLPRLPRLVVAATAFGLAVCTLPGRVYAPDLKADWRAASIYLRRVDPAATGPVVVASTDPSTNVEIETARYYLGPDRLVVPMPEPPDARSILRTIPPGTRRAWIAIGLRRGEPARRLPDEITRDGKPTGFPGLRFVAIGLEHEPPP
jgi:mannosyltransferase